MSTGRRVSCQETVKPGPKRSNEGSLWLAGARKQCAWEHMHHGRMVEVAKRAAWNAPGWLLPVGADLNNCKSSNGGWRDVDGRLHRLGRGVHDQLAWPTASHEDRSNATGCDGYTAAAAVGRGCKQANASAEFLAWMVAV